MGDRRRGRLAGKEADDKAADCSALLARWRDGDASAGVMLAEAYLSMVTAIARRWRRPGILLVDLVQEGRLGVIEALRRHDARTDPPLTPYVTSWAESRIKTHVMEFSGPVRPTASADRAEFFSKPASRAVGVPIDGFHEMPDPADAEDSATSALMAEQRGAIIERCMALLSERERDTMMRHRLAEEPETLTHIAATQGIGRQVVHGIETRAAAKIRRTIVSMMGMRLEWLV